MKTLSGKVAVVTGATRGVGKGIAMSLGEQGATVYITGRTVDESQAVVPLPGTIQQTAEEVTQLGGQGIAIRCDHRSDEQVKAVFDQIEREQGRLDILVNNAWAGYEGYTDGRYGSPDEPFWERPVSYWDDNMVGVRWTYASTVFAAPLLIKHGGLIINLSFHVPEPGNPAYGVAKIATDRLTWEMAHRLKPHHVAVMSLYPGLVRTESVMVNAQYFDMSNSESPQFTGRAVAALAADAEIMKRTGQNLIVAKLALEYDFDDVDGKRPHPIWE